MMYKNREKAVAEGVIGFVTALTNEHHADKQSVLIHLQKMIKVELNLLEGNDRSRNK